MVDLTIIYLPLYIQDQLEKCPFPGYEDFVWEVIQKLPNPPETPMIKYFEHRKEANLYLEFRSLNLIIRICSDLYLYTYRR